MPYPAQIDPVRLAAKAREIIEAEGVENLSLQKLASTVGVKAPSLYRHFDSKASLLRAVNLQTNQALVEAIHQAIDAAPPLPRERVLAMAQAYRAFAQVNPKTYALIYATTSQETLPDAAELEALALPLQEQMSALVGAEQALAALRGLWALLHGFILLELNGQFRRGGDLSAAFQQAVEAYLEGWCAHPPQVSLGG